MPNHAAWAYACTKSTRNNVKVGRVGMARSAWMPVLPSPLRSDHVDIVDNDRCATGRPAQDVGKGQIKHGFEHLLTHSDRLAIWSAQGLPVYTVCMWYCLIKHPFSDLCLPIPTSSRNAGSGV